jgi:hypothetical protein
MAYSYVQTHGDGTAKTFSFGFPYIAKENIKVLLNDIPTTSFTFISANTIELNTAPGQGSVVEIRRETTKAERLVDFTDGSVLTERDLDLANAQAFYLTQEAWDRSDVVIARANLSIDAAAQAKQYAEYAYKYERLANDHMDNALDADDRAKAYKEIAGTFAATTKTAATTIEADRAEVSANTDIVLTAKTDVLIAKGVVESQAQLANVILLDAQAAATQAQAVANNALGTANAAANTANSLTETITQVAAQQAEALSARNGAVAAKTAAETAATGASGSASSAASSASSAVAAVTTVANYAESANNHSTAAYNAKTQAETAQSGAVAARTAAETAKTSAQAAATQAVAASDGKADLTYVNAQLATKPNTGSLATVATSGLKADVGLSNVDNTTDANKPVSTAQAAAIALKANAAAVSNVTNTSDANKPVSTAQQTALNLKLDKTGGTLTGAIITGYTETYQAPVAGSAVSPDIALGTLIELATTTNCTVTLPAAVAGKSYTIAVTFGGAHTLTFNGGTAIRWAEGGTAPTTTGVAGKIDLFVFTCLTAKTLARSGGKNY